MNVRHLPVGLLKSIFEGILGRPIGEPVRVAVCPQCSVELTLTFAGSVAVRRCPGCQGAFLEPDSFEKLLEEAEADLRAVDGVPQSEHTFGRSLERRGCPVCRAPMTNYNYRNQVWLDSCEKGHGIWFDQGELAMAHRIRQAARSFSRDEMMALGSAMAASAASMSRVADDVRKFQQEQAQRSHDCDYD